ncbi:unnamed protein product [Urochloa decumbens]|uniref:F-box domain-containing protein n=1 Tax=Urochloa decumbens TaxID=240449 RepID=A0ABC8YXI2_9POAL
MTMARPRVPWSELPQDPISVILTRLDVSDVLNFAWTCKSWRNICRHLNASIFKSGTLMTITSKSSQDGCLTQDGLEDGIFGVHEVGVGKSFDCKHRLLKNKSWIGGKDDWLVSTNDWCYTHYPEVWLDAIVHQGRVVAVNEGGYIYAWSMNDPEAYPIKLTTPEFSTTGDSMVYYLATSHTGRLLLISVHGEERRYIEPGLRMVVSEQDRIEQPTALSIYIYDDTGDAWQRTRSVGDGQSLFLGLNYPFYGRWSNIKEDRVYIVSMCDNDSIIFSMDSEADQPLDKQNYPIKKESRWPDGLSIRTPMWFRPTVPYLTGKKPQDNC